MYQSDNVYFAIFLQSLQHIFTIFLQSDNVHIQCFFKVTTYTYNISSKGQCLLRILFQTGNYKITSVTSYKSVSQGGWVWTWNNQLYRMSEAGLYKLVYVVELSDPFSVYFHFTKRIDVSVMVDWALKNQQSIYLPNGLPFYYWHAIVPLSTELCFRQTRGNGTKRHISWTFCLYTVGRFSEVLSSCTLIMNGYNMSGQMNRLKWLYSTEYKTNVLKGLTCLVN